MSAILALVVILIVAAEYYLHFELAGLLRTRALPPARQTLGVNVDFADASASLVGRSFRLTGLRIANPAGFDEPNLVSVDRLKVNLGLASALGGVARISGAKIDNLQITLARNGKGETNFMRIAEAVNAALAGAPPPPTNTSPARLALDNIRISSVLEYVDHTATNGVNKLRLALDVTADNIRTYDTGKAEEGTITLKGSMDGRTNQFVIDITARVSPIADPMKASFEVKGTIKRINLYEIEGLASQGGLMSDDMLVYMDITCENGVFTDSRIDLKVMNAKLLGRNSVPLPSDLPVTVKLTGTLEKPEVDMWGTVLNTALQNVGSGVNSLINKSKLSDGLNGLMRMLGPKTNE
ncbi:MAG: hypothetical protein C0404_09535 [Verrucomicrobia bacterium]|nr:hypothetical protein [Verrucomicrobiota bacterium]